MEPDPNAIQREIFYGILLLIATSGISMTVWMLVDWFKRYFSSRFEKAVWFVLIIFTPAFLGSIIYYFTYRRKGKPRTNH